MDNESTICRQPNNTSENAHFLDGKVIVEKKVRIHAISANCFLSI